MKVKLDENLGEQGAELFQAAGFDVSTVRAEGLCSSPDQDLIKACRIEKRCLITLDLDFGNPLIFKPSKYSGIAVLRLPPKASDSDLWEACRTLINGLRQESIAGKLWIIQRGRIREYRPA